MMLFQKNLILIVAVIFGAILFFGGVFGGMYLAFISVFLFIGGLLFFHGFKRLKQKRLIQDTPLSKIRSMAMGLVKVHGRIVDKGKVLISPLNKKQCVYYNCTIEEYRKSGKSGGQWVAVFSNKASVPFYIQDQTGEVLVDLTGAEVNIKNDTHFRSGLFTKVPPEFEPFLNEVKIRYKIPLFNISKKMRFREDFLLPHDDIYLIGSAGQTTASEIEEISKMFNPLYNNPESDDNSRTVQQKSIIFTPFGNRSYQPKEMETINQNIFSNLPNYKSPDRTIIKMGENKIFIASDRQESDLLKNISIEISICIIVGAILMTIGLTGTLIYLISFFRLW